MVAKEREKYKQPVNYPKGDIVYGRLNFTSPLISTRLYVDLNIPERNIFLLKKQSVGGVNSREVNLR